MTTNGISNLDNGENFWSNGFSAGLWSAASAAVTFGIGDVFGATGSLLKEFGRAGAHSLASGTFSHLQGGNFWHGAASGGISSLGGSGMQALGFNDPAMIAGSAALGGLGSKISGGDFWQGFATGIAIGAFNHAIQNEEVNRIRRKILKIAQSYLGSEDWNYDVAKDNIGKYKNKCSQFVSDVLHEAGLDMGTPNGGFFGKNEYPITAGQWADSDYKIEGWKIVKEPKGGDVVAVKLPRINASGHVAIISGGRAYLHSIGTSERNNSIARTPFGYDKSDTYTHGQKYVYRRYVGK